jgi:phenylalanyl-tRNA synthetase alpha chain
MVSLFSTEYVSEKEIRFLRVLERINARISLRKLSTEYKDIIIQEGLDPNGLYSLTELLRSKDLVYVERIKRKILKTTEKGVENLELFPEEKLVKYLIEKGSEAYLEDLRRDLGDKYSSLAIGFAKKRGWIKIENNKIYLLNKGSLDIHKKILREALRGVSLDELKEYEEIIDELRRRGLIYIEDEEDVLIEISEKGRKILREASERIMISRLNADMISTGAWRRYILKEYNIDAEPPELLYGLKHFYRDFLENLKDIMISLGFDEIVDEIVIPELWNFDALFQAQDHPAREIHDSLILKAEPADLKIYEELINIIKRVHEDGFDTGSRGWGYKFDPMKSARMILRSQTTAATIKYLYEHKDPPQRAFIIGKVFRHDVIDSKHLPEFFQMDGIIMEKDMNLRKLLGILTQISEALGLGRPLFKPGYFPFTEPSIEGYVRIGDLGYVEIFGSGLFRPEVLRIAGVKYNVGAWGFGVDRLAMAVIGVNDIRDLYTYSFEKLRRMKIASSKTFYR